MTLWDLLFTNQKSAPPEFGLWYFFLPVSLLVVGYFSIKYAQSKSYQRFWYWAQLIQVLTINAWYILAHMPLTDNLPFYHCRLAMLAILFAPRGTYIKQYFALLGVLGSIAALVYPAFDPFPFPHITVLNLIFSHWALLANSLIYLHQDYFWHECLDFLGQPFDERRLRLLTTSTNHWRPGCSFELPLGQHCDGSWYLLGQPALQIQDG